MINAHTAVDEPLVADVMTAPCGTIRTSAALRTTALALQTHDFPDVLIVDEDGRLCAVVSERDLVRRGLGAGLGPDDPVGAMRCSRPLTVNPTTPAGAALDLMLEHHVRGLPVTSRGRLLGRVTMAAVSCPHASVRAQTGGAHPGRCSRRARRGRSARG